jgi:hypothetical protein
MYPDRLIKFLYAQRVGEENIDTNLLVYWRVLRNCGLIGVDGKKDDEDITPQPNIATPDRHLQEIRALRKQ